MPMDMPAITVSASGVSITRFGPKRSSNPSVARNTPPFLATSSPNTTTRSSSCMARASAMVMAESMVASAISATHELFALPGKRRRQRLEEMIEHRFRLGRRDCRVFGDGSLDLLLAFGEELLFVFLRPPSLRAEIGAQTRERIDLPGRGDQLGLAVAGRIIGRGVVTDAIGEGLDDGCALAFARALHRFADNLAHRDDVVTVDLDAGDAGRNRLLRERLGGRLLLHGKRDRPVVVDHDEDSGK